MEPCSVAADVRPQGSAQEQDKDGASSHDPAPFVHEELDVELGDYEVQDDADAHGDDLLDGHGMVLGLPAGCGVDHGKTVQIGGQAQTQQHMVSLPQGIYDQIPNGGHCITSILSNNFPLLYHQTRWV